jgi:ABC-type Fe3+ transport system substrate-binding protein
MKYNYNYRDKDGNPAPKFLMVNGCQVWNPTAQMYADAGYLPYTPPQPTAEEMAEQQRLARIDELKQLLADSDYKAIKYAEGWLTAEDYADTKAQRQEWRDEINRLEGNSDE